MLRVAFVTILPSPYQVDLFRALARQPETDLSVFYMEEEAPDSPWPATARQPYEHVMPGFWLGAAGARLHVNWNLPRAADYDVMVVSSYMSATGQYLMRFGMRGTPWIFWGERMRQQPHPLKRLVQNALSLPLRRASAIVGMGTLAEQSYRTRFPGVPTFNIPYYTDLQPFEDAAAGTDRWEDGEIRFICCGQMIARKGIDLLLQAFDRLVAEGSPVRLILVGREAELPSMLARMSERGRSAVDFRGFHAPSQLPADFADADAFILPSRHDGWGVVVNQALGAGLPIRVPTPSALRMILLKKKSTGSSFKVTTPRPSTRA